MNLKEKAIEAHRKANERYDIIFRINAEEKLEEIIGDTPYEVEETPDHLIFKVDNLVLLATTDDNYDHVFRLMKKCAICGDLYGEEFSTLSSLGRILSSTEKCECGEESELLLPIGAMKEIERQFDNKEGFIVMEPKH